MIEEKVVSFLLTDMELSLSFVSFGGYDPDVIQSDEDQEKEIHWYPLTKSLYWEIELTDFKIGKVSAYKS